VTADSAQHAVVFLPFLRLNKGHSVAGVDFLPLRDGDGKVPEALGTVVEPLTKILSGYIDRQGKPFTNCVVATLPGKGWDLEKQDFPTVTWAASLLFFASWAQNVYYPRFGGSYVNSSYFRPVGQGYTGAMPVYIAVSARRRDGRSMDGGYKHGEFKFSIPTQCSTNDTADVDELLLAALDVANAADSPVIQRLRSALPFVELANTDDDLMTEHAEAILMGSAFEQLLAGDASSFKLGRKFGALFKPFGSVTVAEAQKARPDIEIDTSDPQRAVAQPNWWVHRKWMEELYDVRSKVVHKGQHAIKNWGWHIFEHLVMSAFVLSLVAKLLLEREGYYTRTTDDEARCLAVDKLLAVTGWADEDETDPARSWQKIVSKTKSHLETEKIVKEFLKERPDFFTGAEVTDALNKGDGA
jgi:hypothetical protein